MWRSNNVSIRTQLKRTLYGKSKTLYLRLKRLITKQRNELLNQRQQNVHVVFKATGLCEREGNRSLVFKVAGLKMIENEEDFTGDLD